MFYPFEWLAAYLADNLLGLAGDSALRTAVEFFVYDSLKIIFLLLVINFLMAALRYYLPIEKLRDFLLSRRWYGFDYLLAGGFGSLTPFCSCSSIPLFVGFLSAGVPLGVTMSFLITSPLVNQVAVVLLVGLFGWQVTVWYVLAAIGLGVTGGVIIDKLKLENQVVDYVWQIKNQVKRPVLEQKPIGKLCRFFWREGWNFTKKIIVYVLFGIGVGALIHGFVPTGYFEHYITADNIFAVPLAVIFAVPLYANVVGVIPIMQSLVEKGIPLGTALAFMMAVVGLSLPEALILKKVMKWKLLFYFFAVTAINIMIIGFLFNGFLD